MGENFYFGHVIYQLVVICNVLCVYSPFSWKCQSILHNELTFTASWWEKITSIAGGGEFVMQIVQGNGEK